VRLLQEHPAVAADHVVVAGHSMGGKAAVRAVETMERQAALAGGPELSADTPAARLPFGLSGAYWLDLRGFDPVATAAGLDTPMLILQGGRDYQVTVDDDLARWRAGLAGRGGVTIRVHDADDHLFFPGTGPSGPADYERPQHVDPAVVDDIAGWLAGPAAGGTDPVYRERMENRIRRRNDRPA